MARTGTEQYLTRQTPDFQPCSLVTMITNDKRRPQPRPRPCSRSRFCRIYRRLHRRIPKCIRTGPWKVSIIGDTQGCQQVQTPGGKELQTYTYVYLVANQWLPEVAVDPGACTSSRASFMARLVLQYLNIKSIRVDACLRYSSTSRRFILLIRYYQHCTSTII